MCWTEDTTSSRISLSSRALSVPYVLNFDNASRAGFVISAPCTTSKSDSVKWSLHLESRPVELARLKPYLRAFWFVQIVILRSFR